jgi:transcription elongation GreA/GreB family factor
LNWPQARRIASPRLFAFSVLEETMMKLNDLHVSLTDAKELAAMLGAHRRAGSLESDPAEALAELLAQARRVPAEGLSTDRVAMGSTVTYVEEPAGARRTVTLAYPGDADLASSKISVFSPIGRALLGRKRGDIVDVALPAGRLLEIHIAETHVERRSHDQS